MKKFLQRSPLFLVLLPVFFLAHLLTDYFRVLYFHHLFIAETFWYLFISLLLFIFLSTKKPIVRRLTLLVFVLQFLFFFFGPIHGFLEENIPVLGKYTVMILASAAFIVILAIFLVRSKQPFYNTYQYLNIVLLVLVGYELVLISLLNITDGKIKRIAKDYPISDNYVKCDTCSRPDIYFLVFDMYANSKVLKSFWNYDNTRLEQFLDSSGFYRAKNSTSNYNYTVFSMGSTLNMDYQEKSLKYTNAYRSSGQLSQFEDNELFRILKKEGYQFYNYSWFHFIDAPARVAPFVLTEPRELIAAQTFWFRFRSDIAWNFKMFRKKRPIEAGLTPFFLKECEDNLSRIRESHKGIKQLSAETRQQPLFLYAHFLMPHAPFLFDSLGNIKPKIEWLSTRHEDYLEQLKYTNNLITDLCTTLLKDAKRPRIIIVQSDHGYRNFNSKDNLTPDVEFENFSAFYFPGGRYGQLYDSISAVNTFRVVLNEYFHYKLPLLKDTSFYMKLR
ncbi:MAG TPA: sulfatase-like hydrolase/transferase [Chitinophagaceae bacterium]|nr:sulfatase-like hydrolase/transferase [Chitinophagaceae bacterium]